MRLRALKSSLPTWEMPSQLLALNRFLLLRLFRFFERTRDALVVNTADLELALGWKSFL